MMRATFATLILIFSHVAVADMASMETRLPKLLEFKGKGLIGEKLDGMVGAVTGDAAAAALAAEENLDRETIYQQRARKSQVPFTDYLRVIGEERIKKEPPGRFVQDPSGTWKQK